MSLSTWCGVFLVSLCAYDWVIYRGGAQKLVGLRAFWLIGWFSWDWTAEQIRLYAYCLAILQTIWFLLGLWQPALRFI